MCLGFVGAGILIGNSYLEWQKNPVATSISTLSISDLQFPNVTICPPKGSNTALNYDLMKADSNRLQTKQQQKLQQVAYKIFVEARFQEYYERLLQQINLENLENIFSGYQTIPKTIDNVTTATFFSTNGTYHTPAFGGKVRESFFESEQHYRVKLELPKGVKEQIGSGLLVFDLKVDTRVDLGWNETVRIRNDSAEVFAYIFHPEEKNWEDAEKTCDSEGGHLASLYSTDQQRDVVKVLPYDEYEYYVWVGIAHNKTLSVWELGANHTCTALLISLYGDRSSPVLHDVDCLTLQYPFVCQSGKTNITGRTELRLTYTREELSFTSFFVEYVYSPTYSEHHLSWKNTSMTGFRLSWVIQNENPPMSLETQEIGSVVESPGFKDPAYQSSFYENDHIYEAILKAPLNLADKIGDGSLAVEIEVSLKEGWGEEVQISKGDPKAFTYHTETLYWHDAEAYCQSMGGNLASIESEEELEKIKVHLSPGYGTWIGGFFEVEEGTWKWSDGSPWEYSPWQSDYERSGSRCASAWTDYYSEKDYFYGDSCGYPNTREFICQTTSQVVERNTSVTLKFTAEQSRFSYINVCYRNAVSKQQILRHSLYC